MATLVVEPVVHEPVEIASPLTATQPETVIERKEELNPLVVVFIACVIAFHLSLAMVGTTVAWIYELRHSGAFAP